MCLDIISKGLTLLLCPEEEILIYLLTSAMGVINYESELVKAKDVKYAIMRAPDGVPGLD